MKKGLIILYLTAIFTCIVALFWYKEWIYNLPTPIPAKYQNVAQGQQIELSDSLRSRNHKPIFLHFFNPDCPCSRFNITHVKSLIEKYGTAINFTVVVTTVNNKYTADRIREKFGLNVPVLFDSALATKCGVYSTPQAVLIDNNSSLYYRGNYNRTRYCSDPNTNYAQIAIEDLLASKKNPVFSQFAMKAYGCSLPKCTPQ